MAVVSAPAVGLPAGDRYTVISADCHGGASIAGYRPYLASRYHDDFDAWVGSFDNPYQDLTGDDAERNWDSARRLSEMEANGVVGPSQGSKPRDILIRADDYPPASGQI